MSFAQEEEELDWGDAVDVVSLGDEEEIPYTRPQVDENEVQEPAPTTYTPDQAPEPAPFPAKSRSTASSIHPLGLSHLPPKPHTVVSGRRSRETITAAVMSRTLLSSRSSPGSAQNDVPRSWETRRSEHTEHHTTSHLKRPPRDETRVDKDYREEEAPPSSSDRLHSARNASSGRAAWPERSPAHHTKSSTRTLTPSSREESPPPRTRSPDAPSRQKPNEVQPPRPRSLSPSSMLIPRRGQSPARGLAKHANNASVQGPYDAPDDGYSNGSRESYPDRYRETGRDRHSRNERDTRSRADHYTAGAQVDGLSRVDDMTNTGFPRESRDDTRRQRDRDVANGTTDHYSPPPEDDEARPKHDSRRRSISPPRQTAMRSDAMALNQHVRRSLSPRVQGDTRAYGRPPLERMASDSHVDRGFTRGRTIDDGGLSRNRRAGEHDGRRSGVDYVDQRDEQFRGRDMRIPGQISHVLPAPSAPIPLHTREVEQLPPDASDPRFHGPVQFRDERFQARPDNRRMHSSRSGHVQAPRVDPSSETPRRSPHNIRNNVPLPPRRDFVPVHEGASHGRGRNGEMRERGMPGERDTMDQHRELLPLNHEVMAMPPEGHELHHEDLVRQHRHRHTGSREEYMAVNEPPPPEVHERHMANVNPQRRTYTPRNRNFPPHQASGPREPEFNEAPDFRPRESGHFPATEHRGRGASFTGSHPQDVISHDYEPSSLPHGHHLPLHDAESIPSNRPYQVSEPQRRDQPPGRRDTYPGRHEQDGQLIERTSRTWERGVDVPTPPDESRHRGRRQQSDVRRPQREVVSDTEFLESRGTARVHPEGGRVAYDDMAKDIRSGRQRPQRDVKQSYGPENRGWVPRDAPPHQEMSSVAHMEIDPHEGAPLPPGESLPGWAGLHRRDRSPQVRNQTRPYRPRTGTRETWPPPPGHDREAAGTENGPEGKRQKVDGGTRAINTFSRDEGELSRKVPQHSPIQRPKPRSPVNTFTALPQPAIIPPTVIPKVDIEAARARAKNVASQLGLANPTARTKSRFSQLVPDSTPTILVTNSSTESHNNSGPAISSDPKPRWAFAHDSSTSVGVKESQGSRLEEPRHDRQGSADSSDPLVASMGGAHLDENERAGVSQEGQGRPNTHRNSRWDPNFHNRDRNRTEPPRNGNGNNGNRNPKGDFWRTENSDAPRTSGMRAWGGQEGVIQRDAPHHTFAPPVDRAFVPWQAGERNFVPREAMNRPFVAPEGLPARPPTPTEFLPGMANPRSRNRANTGGQSRSPQRNRSFVTDSGGPDTTMETFPSQPSGSEQAPVGLSFLPASNSSRKHSLLYRMSDPDSGEPLVTRLSGEQQGGNDGQYQRQQRRPRVNRPITRR